ncbi:hypothetical protein GH714_027973 [Hevea brasiliensis]|uniref:DUF4005 domain-containing protein n=1 Tax=Hevea brasiliensis TaxID=3981 RepID=A0A6A6LGS5_HEVBR|nr:hypothetical protein GH714_027973 [Hevea brasiliensis]
MGKSPGKWIKSLILGRKSSKSKLSRGNDASVLIQKDEENSGTYGDYQVPSTNMEAGTLLVLKWRGSEHGATAKLQKEGFTFPFAQRDENAEENMKLGSEGDPERIRHETAATKAQAAFRGYLNLVLCCLFSTDASVVFLKARRAFRTLKGIIRLQALFRGRLVRRQAIATLCCVHAIVKLQALVRGHKVRCSTVGIEVRNACNMGKVQGAMFRFFWNICINSSGEADKNVFVQKLLALSSGTIPLSLHYSPEEPNSSWSGWSAGQGHTYRNPI